MSNIIDARALMWRKIIEFDNHLRTADEVTNADFEQVKEAFKNLDLLLKSSLNSIVTPSVSEHQIHEKLDELMYNTIGSDPPPPIRFREDSTPSVSEIIVNNTQKFVIVGGKSFNLEAIDMIDKNSLSVTLRSGKEIVLNEKDFNKINYCIQCQQLKY